MAISYLKQRFKDFVTNNVVGPLSRQNAEVIFQNIFDNQCRKASIQNDFYPVGAAAGYSLMYLLIRTLSECDIAEVVELGSGQSTLLIDRVKRPGTRHVCYENDSTWHGIVAPRLQTCDYRLRELTEQSIAGRECRWYRDVEPGDFDLLLVDGPGGEDRFSRFGAVKLIKSNRKEHFVIIFDDSARPGEKDTIEFVVALLRNKGHDIKVNSLSGRTEQTVITTGKYRSVSYYY